MSTISQKLFIRVYLHLSDIFQNKLHEAGNCSVPQAFYMPVITEDTPASQSGIEHVDGYDLLFPIVAQKFRMKFLARNRIVISWEVVGGSQRIDDVDELISRMKELSMKVEDLDWYIDLRRDASLPHGGAGLGFGRAMIVMTGIHNIKDMQEFPRAYGLKCFA